MKSTQSNSLHSKSYFASCPIPATKFPEYPSLPAACTTDLPARLRQSLPQSGSRPTRVRYNYSAQPSIAEAGLASASMSASEACRLRIYQPVEDGPVGRINVQVHSVGAG